MVFISHTTKNHKLALKFADSLSSANVSYWIAPECVDKGKDYVDEIVWAIKRCEYFVLLLSEASQKSSQVRKEVDFAIRYKKKIIPVKLGSCKISERYEYLLADIQIENITNTKNPDFSSIVDKCKLGEKVVTLEITSTPKRNILIMKGDYQENLDTFL